MKRLLISTVSVLGLAAAGSSQAAPNPYVFGASSANIFFGQSIDFNFSIGAGTGNVFGDVGARGQLEAAFGGSVVALTLEGNLVLPLPQRTYTPYFGGGVSFGLLSTSSSTLTAYGIQGVIGVDIPINRNGRFFIEAVPAYGLSDNRGFSVSARAGLKLNLDD